MNYNDEGLLPIEQYEIIARAYADALKKKGLKVVNLGDTIEEDLINSLFTTLADVKSLLFALGGFLNTSSFYSLNERQIKKLQIIFDRENIQIHPPKTRDKTRCFLSFLSCEFSLIQQLISISEKCSFESEIKNIINQRLNLLSQILSL